IFVLPTRSILFPYTTLFRSISLFAQDAKLVYRLGLGPGIEGNMGLWGVNVVNELTWYITDRFSLNPSVTFFQSTGQMEKDEVLEDRKSTRLNSSHVKISYAV